MAKIVVKWGGSLQDNGIGIADDIAQLSHIHQVTVIHGGSRDIADTMRELGVPHRTLQSPDGMVTRYTDDKTLSALIMAMRGRTQTRIVSALNARGVPTVGLSGMDGNLVQTERKLAIRAVVNGGVRVIRDNLAGRIVNVDTSVLDAVHNARMVPLVCPPGMTSNGEPTNVDADRMACEIAVAWNADSLILLTDTAGLLADPADPDSLIKYLDLEDARNLLPKLSGGMRMKVAAVVEAIDKGARKVQICDGRTLSPITEALQGLGTTIVKTGTSI